VDRRAAERHADRRRQRGRCRSNGCLEWAAQSGWRANYGAFAWTVDGDRRSTGFSSKGYTIVGALLTITSTDEGPTIMWGDQVWSRSIVASRSPRLPGGS
jgi:hypothetical protein